MRDEEGDSGDLNHIILEKKNPLGQFLHEVCYDKFHDKLITNTN